MKQSYRYFENDSCEYYPCHKGLSQLNCLFCYCPMYFLDTCLGNPMYMEMDGQKIKDCCQCDFPHNPEHYDQIMDYLKKQIENRSLMANER